MEEEFAYRRIYNDLLEDIRSGRLPEGAMVPTEHALAQKYQVSRITSRRALNMLASEGYILRQRGRGSQVIRHSPEIQTIGLALAGFDSLFGQDFVRGVIREAHENGYLVILQTGYFLRSQEDTCLRELVRAGVRGIVTVPLYESTHCSETFLEVSRSKPLVLADRDMAGLEAPLVCTDNGAAMELLGRKLCDMGHRRIAFVSGSTDSTAVGERYRAYIQFCRQEGLPCGKSTVFTDVRCVLPGMDRRDVKRRDLMALKQFLNGPERITAVIAHTYVVGELVCEAVRQLGLRVPEDISVVCFDAPSDAGQFISHIQQDEYAMGVKAVSRLIEMIQGKAIPRKTYVTGRYVEGKSCAPR